MKKCCCTILAVVFMLAFVTTTLASDFVLEFYLQTDSSSAVPIKNLHCMLIDSKNNRVLDEQCADDDICKVKTSLEEGVYSLIVEEPVLHYFGNTKVLISSQSSSSMVFLLNKLGLSYLEGVHSCENNLFCLAGEECECDDECVCKRFHQDVMFRTVGQTTNDVEVPVNETLTQGATKFPNEGCVTGQPIRYCCSYADFYGITNDSFGAYGNVGYGGGVWGGAWGLLGMLGMIGFIHCPKPISEEPVYR